MIFLAIIIGIYSYVLFFIGITNSLTKTYITISFFAFLLILSCFFVKNQGKLYSSVKGFITRLKRLELLLFVLLFLQVIVNFIGVLGPELGFDALWYHLTIPKIFLQNRSVYFIPGNLFYYSLLPKLTEMLYIVPLSLWDEKGAKLIHFCFGLLTVLVLYRFSRLFFERQRSLLVLAIYYANPVIGWESISAYIDMTRAFYETLSIYLLFVFFKTNRKQKLLLSGVFIGLSIAVKLISIGSLIIETIFLFFYGKKKKILNAVIFLGVALCIPLPWFIFSYFQSGNPVYPLFSGLYSDFGYSYLSPIQAFKDVFFLFTSSSDPLSPMYIILFPLTIFYFKKYKENEKRLIFFSIASIIIWMMTPRTGGSRFFIPYLSTLSITVVFPFRYLKGKNLKRFLILCIIFAFSVSILYRTVANLKVIPVVLGFETKEDFLLKHLNFSYGDFYDEEESIKKIVRGKTVLLYGLHNLFYVDFPFIDSSYVKNGGKFSFILTQNVPVPTRFKDARMIYSNKRTHVKLYSTGEKIW